ncbi:hypothetical protein MLD38_008274 [Melastoma candidum]|uniref:Uncharacterized protein n=1 Tax=Melastoma candidum TaxID=119954 RepID=A0ACB9RY37_9MYRT|nr:hypothetical protein MLD38_008274 [Melastoma candidum]
MSTLHDRKLLLFAPSPVPSNATLNTTSAPPQRPNGTVVSSPPRHQPFLPQLTPSTNQALNSSIALTIVALLTALFFMSFLSLYFRRIATASTTLLQGDGDDPYPFPHRGLTLPPPPSVGSNYPRRFAHPDVPSCSTFRKGVDPWVLDALPVFSYSGEAKYQVDCAICLGELEEEERVKVMPCCEHVFHAECIDRWLRSNGSCPVCRDTQLTSSAIEPCRP